MTGDLKRRLMAYLIREAAADMPVPSPARLCQDLGCAAVQLADALAFLEGAGRIKRHRAETPGGTSVVIELLDEGLCLTPAVPAVPAGILPVRRVAVPAYAGGAV